MSRNKSSILRLAWGAVLVLFVIVAALLVKGALVNHEGRVNYQGTTNGSPATSSSQSTYTELNAAKGYLDIKEWNVRLPLPEDIKDAYYVVSTSSSRSLDGKPGTVWLGLDSIKSKGCDASTNNRGGVGAVGAILRISPDDEDPISGQLLTKTYPNGVMIGDYYYVYKSWSAANPCAKKTHSVIDADADFTGAVRNLKSSPQNSPR